MKLYSISPNDSLASSVYVLVIAEDEESAIAMASIKFHQERNITYTREDLDLVILCDDTDALWTSDTFEWII